MIHVGNCLDILPRLEADRFDSIVTDPPYGLGFMGKGWDHAVPGREFWEEALVQAGDGAQAIRDFLDKKLKGRLPDDPKERRRISDALARLKQPEIRPATGFQHFAASEELIHQGDDADHVFVIIEGHAEAWVDGQKVGDVQKDEIFGAMAVFTREKRSATVIASEPCTVMVIPKDQFLSLMQSNPRIAHSLIESMARRIDLMNKEVTQLRAQLQPA